MTTYRIAIETTSIEDRDLILSALADAQEETDEGFEVQFTGDPALLVLRN